MNLLDAIDLNDLHKYSNIDVSTIRFDRNLYEYIAKFDYTKFIMFIDIFDDVNKPEFVNTNYHGTFLTFAENVIFAMYYKDYLWDLTNMHKMKILFRLLQRGFSKSMFDKPYIRELCCIDSLFVTHMTYLTKYYDAITNLFRLTNNNTIEICNLDDSTISTINTLLLIAKTRIVPQEVALPSLPKYIILHKILLFYLGYQ